MNVPTKKLENVKFGRAIHGFLFYIQEIRYLMYDIRKVSGGKKLFSKKVLLETLSGGLLKIQFDIKKNIYLSWTSFFQS